MSGFTTGTCPERVIGLALCTLGPAAFRLTVSGGCLALALCATLSDFQGTAVVTGADDLSALRASRSVVSRFQRAASYSSCCDSGVHGLALNVGAAVLAARVAGTAQHSAVEWFKAQFGRFTERQHMIDSQIVGGQTLLAERGGCA